MVPKPPALDGEATDSGDLQVEGRILAANIAAYHSLVGASAAKGISQEQVTTNLINAGLVEWVGRMLVEAGAELEEAVEEEKSDEH